jgi:hypothetical protein
LQKTVVKQIQNTTLQSTRPIGEAREHFFKSKLSLNEMLAITFMWWNCWPLSRIRDEIPFGNNRTLGKVFTVVLSFHTLKNY